MIFVTLGTQDKQFLRLVKAVEQYAISSGDQVIVQAGYTKYNSEYLDMHEFLSQDDFESNMKHADVVVTHAGVGSILTALKYKKPIVAAARSVTYKEHTNEHQIEILSRFEEEGYVIALNDFKDINEAIKQAKDMEVKTYTSNNEYFVSKLRTYIDSIK